MSAGDLVLIEHVGSGLCRGVLCKRPADVIRVGRHYVMVCQQCGRCRNVDWPLNVDLEFSEALPDFDDY